MTPSSPRLIGPLVVAIHDRRSRGGTGRLVTTYLDDRPRPIRRLSRFIAFGLIVLLAVGGLTARLFYLQIVDGGRFATLSARNRTVLEAIPCASWPDLRPRRSRPRHERADVRGQGPAGRPAPGSFDPQVVERLAALLDMDIGRDQRHDRLEPGLELRPRPDRGRRRRTDRAPDLGGRVRPARRRDRRRGAPPVHVRPAAVADPRLHRPGLGRAAAKPARRLGTCPTTSSARPGSRPQYETELRGTTARRASSATPRVAGPRSSRRSARPARATRST